MQRVRNVFFNLLKRRITIPTASQPRVSTNSSNENETITLLILFVIFLARNVNGNIIHE